MARQDSKPGRARSGWDVLTDLGAIVVLLALVIGPPIALITVFGVPIPHTMPSASLLTHRLQAPADAGGGTTSAAAGGQLPEERSPNK